MKKIKLLVLLAGLTVFAAGCGFSNSGDTTVTVIEATPTPEPTPTPEVTPTPEATPTPVPVIEQTPSGVNVEVKDGTYYTTSDVNLRPDCNTDGDYIVGIPEGTELKSTGVCENGWIRVEYDGQVGYVTGDYVTTTAPSGETAVAETSDTAETMDAAE
jgi:uncharacterized protein YgiM (DUF1202 family)